MSKLPPRRATCSSASGHGSGAFDSGDNNNHSSSLYSYNQQQTHVSNSIKKWTCWQCTYENYPKSMYCIMCRFPKPGHNVIIEPPIGGVRSRTTGAGGGGCNRSEEEIIPPSLHKEKEKVGMDIYKMRSLMVAVDDMENEKWSCSFCTYLNYPKAIRCTQCLKPKNKPNPTSSSASGGATPLHNRGDSPLSGKLHHRRPIDDVYNEDEVDDDEEEENDEDDEDHDDDDFVKDSRQTRNQVLASNYPASEHTSSIHDLNDRNRGTASLNASSIGTTLLLPLKWTCPACTYLNWDKSTRCTLCFTVKPSSKNGSLTNLNQVESNLSSHNHSRPPHPYNSDHPSRSGSPNSRRSTSPPGGAQASGWHDNRVNDNDSD